jgi:hypothetical protein
MCTGCQQKGGLLTIDAESEANKKIVAFYFGSFATTDPYQSGVLKKDGDSIQLDVEALEKAYPEAKGKLQGQNGTLSMESIRAFMNETYYAARKFPPTLQAFRAEHSYSVTDPKWFSVRLNGAMSSVERTIYIEYSALKAALSQYKANNQQLLYPVGTVIIGEYTEGGAIIETTLEQKRADNHWDYWIYDASGNLAKQTLEKPKALKAPTQCVGCHYGKKLYEPEKSYPADAPVINDVLRKIQGTPAPKTAEMVAFFQEHAKRSDTILGVYNTIFVSNLLEKRDKGTLNAEETQLLTQIGL